MKTHAPSMPSVNPPRLEKFLLEHDQTYRDNLAVADQSNSGITRWLFNAARRRAVSAGLITQQGKPVFRNEPHIVIVQHNKGRGM